jgi:uncharacterized membrane protein YhaH (DUF805 family)
MWMASDVNPYAAPRAEVHKPADDEMQEVRLFAVSGRIGRVRYIAYMFSLYVFVVVAAGALAGLLAAAIGRAVDSRGSNAFLTLLLVPYIAMFVLHIMLAVQRCHDFDSSGWWVLLLFVPVINFLFWLFLLFKAGNAGSNRFGARTPPNSAGAILVAWLLPLLVVSFAVVGLMAFSDFAMRGQHTQMRR